jgi:hypothetical protein
MQKVILSSLMQGSVNKRGGTTYFILGNPVLTDGACRKRYGMRKEMPRALVSINKSLVINWELLPPICVLVTDLICWSRRRRHMAPSGIPKSPPTDHTHDEAKSDRTAQNKANGLRGVMNCYERKGDTTSRVCGKVTG